MSQQKEDNLGKPHCVRVTTIGTGLKGVGKSLKGLEKYLNVTILR